MQRLGLGVAPLDAVYFRETVEAGCQTRVLRAECFCSLDCGLEPPARLAVIAIDERLDGVINKALPATVLGGGRRRPKALRQQARQQPSCRVRDHRSGPSVAQRGRLWQVYHIKRNDRSGSTAEVQRGHQNVRCWGQSRPLFRAVGLPILANSRPS